MRNGFFRFLIAAILIALGVILVLENIGVAEFNLKSSWLYIYPVLFIMFGAKWMIDRMRYRGGSWVFGSFFFIFGSLLLLDRFQVFTFAFKDIFKLWPLLIVYFGFLFIRKKNVYIDMGGNGFGGKKKRKNVYDETYYDNDLHNDIHESIHKNIHENIHKNIHKDRYKKYKVKKDYKGSFFSVGDHEYSEPNWKVKPMHLSNLAGDFYFDFTKAFIPEKEIPISIKSLAGDVRILIPENVEFRVTADVKAGDIDVLGQQVDGINRSLVYETHHYKTAERKLDFTIKLKAGSIRIDHV